MSPVICTVASCGRDVPIDAYQHGVAPRLCHGCVGRLRADIQQLPRLHDDCEEALEQRRRVSYERVKSKGGGGLSLNMAAMGARAELLSVCATWAGRIATERRLAQRPSRSVSYLVPFLLTHVDWLACHPDAAAAAAEFADVVARAWQALDPDRVRRVELGPCDAPGCDGTVRAVIGGRASGVACERGHSRRVSEWLLLARRSENDAA